MVDAHRHLLAGPGWPLSVSHGPSSPRRGRPPGSSAHTTWAWGDAAPSVASRAHWGPGGSQRGQARVVACPVSECQPSGQARAVQVQLCREARALTAPQRAQPMTEAHPRLEGDRLLTGLSRQPPVPQRWPQPRGCLPRPGPPGLLPQPQLSLGAASGCPVPPSHPPPTLSHTRPSPGAVGKCFRIDS